MKKSIVLVSLVVVIILFVVLPFKVALALTFGSCFITVLYAVLYALAKKSEEELARIEKEDPKLAQKIRMDMIEQAYRNSQMLQMGF